jgi:hypothetical protein
MALLHDRAAQADGQVRFDSTIAVLLWERDLLDLAALKPLHLFNC